MFPSRFWRKNKGAHEDSAWSGGLAVLLIQYFQDFSGEAYKGPEDIGSVRGSSASIPKTDYSGSGLTSEFY